jgi:hypothetical protein
LDTFNRDQDRIIDGRSFKLEDDEENGLVVTADLRDQINKKLLKKLNEKNAGELIASAWQQGNADRQEWLTRMEEFLIQFDEFIDPIYEASNDWSSVLHLPTIYTVIKTYHARMQAALMSIDPFFNVKARKEQNVEQEMVVQDLMRYTFKEWVNEHAGIDEVFDRWIWDWCAFGCGILKARWHKKFTKYVDVENVTVPGPMQFVMDPNTQETHAIPTLKQEEREVEKVVKCFDGPMVERVNIQDVLIVGGEGDPQKADSVIQSEYMTASELWSLADQSIFDYDAVEEVIKAGSDNRGAEAVSGHLYRQTETAGVANVDKPFELDRYQILEAYIKMDIDDSGINSDLVVWIHKESRKILRATYLYRMSPTGKRPFFKIDFHKRNNTEYGVGLVEIMYSLAREIDAMHNIRIDVGIMSSLPWGFYKPTASMAEEKLPIEPGTMIPLDNPGQDVFFPNLTGRTSFGFQEEAALYTLIERVTSISDLSLGIIGGQGAARTATGTQALLGEANANLDVYIRRMNRGVRQMLHYVFGMLQQKVTPGLQFRVIGGDGKEYWRHIESREALVGMYDFELDANSANSNKSIRIQTADFIYQTLQNPLLLQTGVVNVGNLYEALKNMMQVRDIKDVSKYITMPPEYQHRYLPVELANRILAGQNIPLDPTQDLQGFVAFVQEFLGDDELLGQIDQQGVQALVSKMNEAQQMIQAIEAAAAQQRNQQQMMTNQQVAPQSQQLSGGGQSQGQAVGKGEST